MNLLQDIIKILHQPVQLLIAALMFAYKEPKRKFWLIRTVLAAILGFLVLKLCITASPEILLNSFLASLVWSIGSFLILLSIEYSMFDVELKMAAYFTTLAYLTQHVAFCAWDAIQPGAGYNEPHYCSLKDIVVDTFIPFAVFALVYVVIYLLIARPMVKHGYASVSVGYSFTTMIAVLLISIDVLQSQIKRKTNGSSCGIVKLLKQNQHRKDNTFAMNTVTQTMRFRQSLLNYAEKHSVTKAAIKYNVNCRYIYRWKRRYNGDIQSLANNRIDRTTIQISIQRKNCARSQTSAGGT